MLPGGDRAAQRRRAQDRVRPRTHLLGMAYRGASLAREDDALLRRAACLHPNDRDRRVCDGTACYRPGRRARQRGRRQADRGCPRPTGLAHEGIEGAIWHTIYAQTTGGGTGALPELSDYLAYVVLAPFLGAEQAAQIVTEQRPSEKVA